ncbi:MAG: hypothetical protein QOJ22_303 [Thermoleophilaceae bacterium]|nr:hypothetical protein [Thermoleophilaceae bacterium]
MIRNALPLAVAALAIAAGGCGSSGDPRKTETVKPASSTTGAGALPQELLGSYERFVSKADIERTQKKRSELDRISRSRSRRRRSCSSNPPG